MYRRFQLTLTETRRRIEGSLDQILTCTPDCAPLLSGSLDIKEKEIKLEGSTRCTGGFN